MTATEGEPPVEVPPMKKKKYKLPMEQKLLVGAVAGVVGTSAIFPLDMIKTRLQAATVKTSPLTIARQIHATEGGIRGFYRGLIPNLTGVTPEKAIKLAVNEWMREFLEDPNGDITLAQEVIAGGTAGFCQVVATNPMEIVKLRMQLQQIQVAKSEQKSAMQVVRDLGLRGLYRGAPATWARDIPYSMIFFPAYSNAQAFLADKDGNTGIFENLACGTFAGMLSAGLMTPSDVVKTRFQQKGGKDKYGSLPNVARVVLKEEGLFAFYKGAVPRMATQGPLFGIALAAFEIQKQYMISKQS